MAGPGQVIKDTDTGNVAVVFITHYSQSARHRDIDCNVMKNTGRMIEGAGGQTFVATGGSNAFKAAAKGSVYAELQVPKNSLLQGGQPNWFKVIGPNAKSNQLFLCAKTGRTVTS